MHPAWQRAAAGIQTFSGGVSELCVWLGPVTTRDREPSVVERVSLFREPDAGNLPVRFDEREQETGPGQTGLRSRGDSPVESPPGDYSHCACSRLYSRLRSKSPSQGEQTAQTCAIACYRWLSGIAVSILKTAERLTVDTCREKKISLDSGTPCITHVASKDFRSPSFSA